MAVEQFLGKWKLSDADSENFDKYLQALGVGWLWRKLAKSSTPHQEWTRSGDTISVKTSTSLRTHTVNFELGKEFDETRIDGEVSKSTIVEEGSKLQHTMKQKDGKESTITREIVDGSYVMTLACGDVTAVRKYVRE